MKFKNETLFVLRSHKSFFFWTSRLNYEKLITKKKIRNNLKAYNSIPINYTSLKFTNLFFLNHHTLIMDHIKSALTKMPSNNTKKTPKMTIKTLLTFSGSFWLCLGVSFLYFFREKKCGGGIFVFFIYMEPRCSIFIVESMILR